ncbi:MAG: 50S ribosomal protein L16 [Candidatus Micrarchaeia archaeon]
MARLRPARTCRKPNSQSWARYSQKKPRKNYIRALPHTSIQIFDMGKDKPEYDLTLYLTTAESIQLRSNALEAARTVAHKFLESEIPELFYMKLLVYPHNVIREHKMASGAGADRVSRGMSLAFGRPVSVAARLNPNQHVFMLKTTSTNKKIAMDAMKKAQAKLSGTYYISTS